MIEVDTNKVEIGEWTGWMVDYPYPYDAIYILGGPFFPSWGRGGGLPQC